MAAFFSYISNAPDRGRRPFNRIEQLFLIGITIGYVVSIWGGVTNNFFFDSTQDRICKSLSLDITQCRLSSEGYEDFFPNKVSFILVLSKKDQCRESIVYNDKHGKLVESEEKCLITSKINFATLEAKYYVQILNKYQLQRSFDRKKGQIAKISNEFFEEQNHE